MRTATTSSGSMGADVNAHGIRQLLLALCFVVVIGGLAVYGTRESAPASTSPVLHSNQSRDILNENAQAGTTAWLIPSPRAATTQIQAYASAPSVQPGQVISFYVSTKREGTPYIMHLYRLGWYSGTGGRLLTSLTGIGHAQGYYDSDASKLVDCNSCTIDARTHLVEANWKVSLQLAIPATWISGVYLAKFVDNQEWQTPVTFVVLGRPSSTYVAVTGDSTVAAYNQWGGYSLYRGPDGTYPTRATKVSLDRPNAGLGVGQGLVYWINPIRWMEQQGYDVSYMSSLDLHEHPAQVLSHRAYIALGHDEYWSREMRDGLVHARDAGVGLAFLSADDGTWQIRFEPNSHGQRDHTIVCYKDASRDPLIGIDNARVTVMWRDFPVNQPENALRGVMYSQYANGEGFPWYLSDASSSFLLRDSGLQVGVAYGCALVGYEWDRSFDNGMAPPHLHILSTSKVRDVQGNTDVSNSAYYIAPSGALVFSTGSTYWTFGLDSLRLQLVNGCAHQDTAVPGMRRLMANIMDALIVKHPVE